MVVVGAAVVRFQGGSGVGAFVHVIKFPISKLMPVSRRGVGEGAAGASSLSPKPGACEIGAQHTPYWNNS